MGVPTPPVPVKLIIALLAAKQEVFTTACQQLQEHYGPIDLASDLWPWTTTNYYRDEMGDHLFRKFVAFESLITPGALTRIKRETNRWELELSAIPTPMMPRRINLDPGYVDVAKLVLASTKDQAHRIYLADGIYGEVTLLYRQGEFQPFLYTYADYRWPETHQFLRRVRTRYLEQTRTLRQERK